MLPRRGISCRNGRSVSIRTGSGFSMTVRTGGAPSTQAVLGDLARQGVAMDAEGLRRGDAVAAMDVERQLEELALEILLRQAQTDAALDHLDDGRFEALLHR